MGKSKIKVWRRHRLKPAGSQMTMFADGSDLPLFSGTPQTHTILAARPKAQGKQLDFLAELDE